LKKENEMKKIICVASVLCIILMASTVFAWEIVKKEHVCKSWTPAMVGGPVAHGKDLLTLRWMSEANVELSYKNQVILLSAYYDKGPDNPRFVELDKVRRADAIFLGHAHGDHMTEAARFALQTGATVYGHYTATDAAIAQGVPSGQTRQVLNGDVFQFDGFTVEAIHIWHSGLGTAVQTPPDVLTAYRALDNLLKDPPSAEQLAWKATYTGAGAGGPVVTEQGVFAYLFTFGKDFRFIYYDSANPTLLPEIVAAMERIGGKTDIATLAYAGGPEKYAIPYDMPEIKLFNPKYFFPSHNYPTYLMDPNPLFREIRKELPGTTPLFLEPGQPLCFSVTGHKLLSNGIIVPLETLLWN
jgi:hypothetical protein